MRKIIFIFAFANAFALRAQTDSLKTRSLNEVVVTATKFAKNLSETGKVLTVIDEDQIKRSTGKDLSQLLNEQAGIVVNGANSNPGKDKAVYLRGAASKYTLILLDGVPLNDPSSIDGGAYDLRMLPLNQIERIEILKGSQSTLYGSDAIAGVINIITKKGSDKTISGAGIWSYGSYNTKKAVANVSGQTQGVDFNLGYSHLDTDGISEAKDLTGNNNFDKDGVTQNSFQANFGIAPTNAILIKPFFRYNTFFGAFDDGAYQDSKIDNSRGTLLNTGLSGQYKLASGSLNVLYGYTNSDRTYTTSYGVSNYKGKFQNAETFWNQNLSDHLQLLGGLNFQRWKMLDSTTTEKNPMITIASPYASFFVKNVNGFSMELGARENIHSKYGNNFTWSFNPSYWLQQKIKLFFNYSTGFKAPMLNQLYGQYGPNPNLKPEKSESIESGFQLVSANKKIDVRGVFFARNIKDVIIYNSQYVYVNYDHQNDYGFEIEPAFYPTKNLTIKGFFALVNGKVKTQTTSGKDTTYNNLIRRPKNSLGISIGYQADQKLFASLSLKTFGQRNDMYYDSNFVLQKTSLAAYQLLDVYFEYKILQPMKLFVDVKNILNQDYMEVAGYNTLKRNINFGINASF